MIRETVPRRNPWPRGSRYSRPWPPSGSRPSRRTSSYRGSRPVFEDGWFEGVRDVASYLLRIAGTTAEQLGKPVGNDIREGIYTLPLLRALQRDPALRPLLRPEIAEVLGRVRTGEAVEKVLTLVAQHVDQAVATSVRPTAPAPVPVSQQRSRTSPAPSSPARP